MLLIRYTFIIGIPEATTPSALVTVVLAVITFWLFPIFSMSHVWIPPLFYFQGSILGTQINDDVCLYGWTSPVNLVLCSVFNIGIYATDLPQMIFDVILFLIGKQVHS